MKKIILGVFALAALANTASAADMTGWGIESNLLYVGSKNVNYNDTITGAIDSPMGQLDVSMTNNAALRKDNGLALFATGTYTGEINEDYLYEARLGVGQDNYNTYQIKPGIRLHKDVGDKTTVFVGAFAQAGHGGQREVTGMVSTETQFSSSSRAGSSALDIDESYAGGVELGIKEFDAFGIDHLTISFSLEVAREKTRVTALYGERSSDPFMASFEEMSENGFNYDFYQTNTSANLSIGYNF